MSKGLVSINTSRRTFLKGSAAAVATLGAVGCAPDKKQEVYPYLKGEEAIIPGEITHYASTCNECSARCGIIVKSVDGRIIKVEGNQDHPINRGGLCALGHSSLQNLYDPDRVRQPLKRTVDNKNRPQFKPISWEEAFNEIGSKLSALTKKTYIVSSEESASSKYVTDELSKALKGERITFDFSGDTALRGASEIVFGKSVVPKYRFDKADVVLNFGADFLETWVSPCEFGKQWSRARNKKQPTKFIHCEPRLSLTAANADLWLGSRPGSEITIVRAFLGAIIKDRRDTLSAEVRGLVGDLQSEISLAEASAVSGVPEGKLQKALNELLKAERPLVVGGGALARSDNPLPILVCINLLNLVLGAVDNTLLLPRGKSSKGEKDGAFQLKEVIASLESNGDIGALLFVGGDPAFTLPSSLGFENAVRKADIIVAVSSHFTDTARLADYVLPPHTHLESWGYDFIVGSFGENPTLDNYVTIQQPAMSPIFDTKEYLQIVRGLCTASGKTVTLPEEGAIFVKDRLRELYNAPHFAGEDFGTFYVRLLSKGVAQFNQDSNLGKSTAVSRLAKKLNFTPPVFQPAQVDSSNELLLYPYMSVKTFDGRAANRPWLQELPDPMTQLVWDTWAEINPETATKLGVKTGDPLLVKNFYGALNIPAFVTPLVVPGVVAVPIGQGHKEYGRYAQSVGGGNVLSLLPANLSQDLGTVTLVGVKVSVNRVPGRYKLVNLSGSDSQLGRDLAKTKFINKEGHHKEDHHGAHGHGHHEPKQMYQQREHPTYRWGMGIDLNSCTGCSACVVACYSENNIPTVGKELCSKGREMSWLRIERYVDPIPHGDDEVKPVLYDNSFAESKVESFSEEFSVSFLPMLCQHCNNAPCEPVCPVYATYHNEEGLNAMVYNRCVGTRYCSNNCSYKVRRFNWVEFDFPEPLNWQLNPNVTKRTSGVMEKCTFCVQRITEAKDRAKDEGRPVADGEVKPACVQSCPTDALVFGDLNDPSSRVRRMQSRDTSYKILDHHLNTQPAISYRGRNRYQI
jgi:molybdopterin-containing oxidoreductase family iron-sulfur binding subunit